MLGTSGDEVAADAAAEAATAVAATAPDSPHRPDLGGGVVPSVTAPSLVTDTDPSDRCPERRAIHLTATAVHLPEDASQTVPRPSESLAQSVLSHHKLTLTDVVPHSSALPPAPNDSSSGKQQSYSQTLKPARAPTPLSSEQIRVTQRSNSPSPTSSFGLVHTTTTAAFGTVDKSDDCFLEPLEALIGSSTAGKPASLLPDAPPSSPSSPKIDSIPIADPPPPSPTRQFVTAISRLYGDKDAVEAGKSNPEDPPDYEISARCFLDDPVLVVGDIVGNGSRAEQEAATEAATTALGTNPNLEKDDDIRHALISQYFPEPNNSLADCIEASASDCGVDDDDAPSTPSLPPPSPNSIFSANSGSSHNEMSSLPTSSTPHQSSHSSPIPNPPPFFDGNPQQHLFPSAPSSGVVGEAGPYDQGPASSFAPHSVSIGQIGASKPTKLASQRLSMTPLDAFSSNATPLSSSRSSPVRSPPQIFPSSESNTVWADRNLRISTTGGSGRPLSFPGFSPSQSLFMWVLAQQHTGGHSHHLSWLDPHVHSPKSMVRERLAKADAYDLNVEASAAVTNSAGDADDLSVETVESQHADRDLFPSDFDSKANSPQSTAMPPEGSEEARISLLSSRSIEIGDPSSFLDPTQLQLSHSPPAQDLHSLQVLSERQDLTEDADVPGDGQDLETLKRPPILYNPVPPTEDLDASAVRLPSSVVKVLDVIARDSNEAEHLPDVSERASSAVKADVAGSALYSVLLKSQSVDQEDSSSTSDTDGEWHSNASSSAVLTENAADVHSTVGEVGVNEESSPLAPEASLNENEESLPTRSFFEYFPQNDPALPSLEAKVLALSLRKSGFLQRLNIAPGRRDAEVDDSQNTAGSGLSRSFSTLWKNRRTATVVDSQRVKSSTRANAVTGRQSPSVRGTSPALEEDDQSNHVVVRSMSQASFQSQQTDLSATSTKVVVNSGGGSGSMGVLGIADSAASFSSSALDWTTYYVEVRGHYMIFYSFQEWGFGVDSLAPFPNSQGKHRPFGTTLDEPQKSEPGLAQTAVAAPSKGWRIGQRPVTPNRDQRNGEERRGSPISGESSSSGLNKIMESMSFSKKPKRRISVFTPATAGRDSPSPIPSKLPHDSMEARSLPRYEDRKLIHYIDLAGTSIELLPPRGPSIVTATTNIVRLTLGNEAILLNMYEGEFSAAESIPIQFPNSFAKDSGSTDWISVLNSVRSKPPLPTLSSQYGSQTSPPKRRPSFISISSKPPESDPQSIASQQFAPEEHLKRSESPLSTPATTSKQSIARLFTSKRKASADGVASDYARSSPIPPSPLQQSTGSYFPSVATSAFGNVGFVEGATPVGTSNNHPQSQMGFHLKPRARGVLTAKSRLSPLLSAPASQDSASIPLDSVVDISSSRIESKESGSVVPLVTGSPVSSKSSPNTGSEPSSESYYHRLGPASSADSSPPQNRNVGSNNTATKLLPIFLGRGGRKPVNGNVPEHTNPAVSSYPPPPIPSNGGEVSTHLSHSPLSPPKAGFSVTRPKQRNSGTIGGATAAVSFPGGGSIGVSPIAMHTPSGVPSSGAADGVVMKRSSTVGSRRMGSFNPKGRSRLVGERPVSVAASWQVPGTSVQRRSERIIQMEDDEEVPILLRKCIELIEAIGLDTEGLYRVSGSAVSQAKLKRLLTADPARVQLMPPRPTTRLDSPTASSPVDFVLPSINPSANALRLKQRGSRLSLSESRATDNDESRPKRKAFETRAEFSDLYGNDVHVVTGVVKSYLREPTREPLCTFQNYESFLNAIGLKDWREKMSSIQDLVHALPRKNFVTLKYLCEHLKRVAASESENRMSIRNLSIIFAPNLLRPPPALDSTERVMKDMGLQTALVESLIEYVDWVFGPVEYEDEAEVAPVSTVEEEQEKHLDTPTLNAAEKRLDHSDPFSTGRRDDSRTLESIADFSARFKLGDLKIVSNSSASTVSDRPRSLRTSRSDSSLNSFDRRRQLRQTRRQAQVISVAYDVDDESTNQRRTSESSQTDCSDQSSSKGDSESRSSKEGKAKFRVEIAPPVPVVPLASILTTTQLGVSSSPLPTTEGLSARVSLSSSSSSAAVVVSSTLTDGRTPVASGSTVHQLYPTSFGPSRLITSSALRPPSGILATSSTSVSALSPPSLIISPNNTRSSRASSMPSANSGQSSLSSASTNNAAHVVFVEQNLPAIRSDDTPRSSVDCGPQQQGWPSYQHGSQNQHVNQPVMAQTATSSKFSTPTRSSTFSRFMRKHTSEKDLVSGTSAPPSSSVSHSSSAATAGTGSSWSSRDHKRKPSRFPGFPSPSGSGSSAMSVSSAPSVAVSSASGMGRTTSNRAFRTRSADAAGRSDSNGARGNSSTSGEEILEAAEPSLERQPLRVLDLPPQLKLDLDFEDILLG